MLHYDGAIPNPAASNDVTDAYLDDIAAAQLAIDREVKERAVPQTPVLVEPKSNSPNLLRFEGALCAPHTALIPGPQFMESWI
ncbi:hypothetical protein H8S47_12255 [Sphingomonas sp. DOAB1063]|uniref:Uncharacterized protein n=1 Tax=Sphingomonas albertensis TaxID=2762591 RepID=A0ABR7APQ7_9SPHN|nr:hypothetical protein [Sphingomonas albertensis]